MNKLRIRFRKEVKPLVASKALIQAQNCAMVQTKENGRRNRKGGMDLNEDCLLIRLIVLTNQTPKNSNTRTFSYKLSGILRQ